MRRLESCPIFVFFGAIMVMLVGLSSAWTPSPRPVAGKQSTKKITLMEGFRPLRWPTTALVAASLAFTPLPSQADDAQPQIQLKSSVVEVKVKVDASTLIESMQESKGDLNSAISNILKNLPADSIQVADPSTKAAPAQPKEAAKEEPKVQVQNEEPKLESQPVETAKTVSESPAATEGPKPTPVVPAPSPPIEAKKEELPKPVEAKTAEPPKPVEVKKIEPPKPVEIKKEVVSEAPKLSVEPPKKGTPPAPKEISQPVAPKETGQPVAPKETSKPVTTATSKPSAAPVAKDMYSGFVSTFKETKEQKAKKSFNDVPFWERPAIRPTVPSPDGRGDTKLVFNTAQITGVALFSAVFAYLVGSLSDNRERRSYDDYRSNRDRRSSLTQRPINTAVDYKRSADNPDNYNPNGRPMANDNYVPSRRPPSGGDGPPRRQMMPRSDRYSPIRRPVPSDRERNVMRRPTEDGGYYYDERNANARHSNYNSGQSGRGPVYTPRYYDRAQGGRERRNENERRDPNIDRRMLDPNEDSLEDNPWKDRKVPPPRPPNFDNYF